MTMTLTDDPTNARVRITATGGLPDGSPLQMQRSINQVAWATVRGGQDALSSGGTLALDDYEYAAGVANYYRVTGPIWDTFSRTVTDAWGTPDVGPAWTATGGTGTDYDVTASGGTILHPSVNIGHNVTLGSDFRDFDAQVSFKTAAGVFASGAPVQVSLVTAWASATSSYQFRAQLETDGSVTAQVVRRSGGAETVWASATVPGLSWSSNTSYRIRGQMSGSTMRVKVWRASSAEPGVWHATGVETLPLLPAGSVGIATNRATGNTNTNLLLTFDDFTAGNAGIVYASASIKPTLDRVWLKSPTRPFLNRAVTVVDPGDPSAASRGTLTEVVGRSLPIAITEVRGSRKFALQLYTKTADDAQTLEYILASGDVLFVHVPLGARVPGGYVQVGDTATRRTRPRSESLVWTLACQVVSPPGPDIAGAISTWTSVLAAYATWADVLAAFPTWSDLLKLVGQPSEVIVP